MSSSLWRRLLQFRLRTLLLVITLLILAGNGFLIWWRMPFHVESRTASSSWEHLQLLRVIQVEEWQKQVREARKEGDFRRAKTLQASPPPRPKLVFRERSRVYRNLSGDYIKHGPLKVFDDKGALLRVEHWVHGALHGPWKDWLPDGRELCWGQYEQGEKHGRWVRLDLTSTERYRYEELYNRDVLRRVDCFSEFGLYRRLEYDSAGSRRVETRWDPRSSPPTVLFSRRHSTDADGANLIAHEGEWRSGVPAFKGQTRNGLEVGEWRLWSEDGSIARRVRFAAGRLIDQEGAVSSPIVPADAANHSPALTRFSRALEDSCGIRQTVYPLPAFASYVGDSNSVPTKVERRVLEQAGISPEVALSVDVPSWISLRAGLQIVLSEAGLAAVVRRDVLVITTPDDASDWSDRTGLPAILQGPETPLRQRLQSAGHRLRFQEAPLDDVLAFFREKNEIPIRLDKSAFPDANVASQRPVTVELAGITIAQGLGFVLDECDMRCVERDGELLVRPRASSISGTIVK